MPFQVANTIIGNVKINSKLSVRFFKRRDLLQGFCISYNLGIISIVKERIV